MSTTSNHYQALQAIQVTLELSFTPKTGEFQRVWLKKETNEIWIHYLA